jgi:hypothetical protein
MADYADLLAAESNKQPTQKAAPHESQKGQEDLAANTTPIQKSGNEARHDVTTSKRYGVNYRKWRDTIENTETHNSALRLTREERYEVEDMIQELERKHKVKTSMNEVARLGILSIIHDYKTNKQESLVYKVKKS